MREETQTRLIDEKPEPVLAAFDSSETMSGLHSSEGILAFPSYLFNLLLPAGLCFLHSILKVSALISVEG